MMEPQYKTGRSWWPGLKILDRYIIRKFIGTYLFSIAMIVVVVVVFDYVEKIDDFNVQMSIPKSLKEFGIIEDEFKEKIAKISELAVGDACTGSNPREIDPATMEKLFNCVYYGTEVDF